MEESASSIMISASCYLLIICVLQLHPGCHLCSSTPSAPPRSPALLLLWCLAPPVPLCEFPPAPLPPPWWSLVLPALPWSLVPPWFLARPWCPGPLPPHWPALHPSPLVHLCSTTLLFVHFPKFLRFFVTAQIPYLFYSSYSLVSCFMCWVL